MKKSPAPELDHKQLIETHTAPPVADRANTIACQGDALMPSVKDNEVVAETMHLSERNRAHAPVIILLSLKQLFVGQAGYHTFVVPDGAKSGPSVRLFHYVALLPAWHRETKGERCCRSRKECLAIPVRPGLVSRQRT